jgi:hypothetical protein
VDPCPLCAITQHSAEKFAKKLLGEREIEAVLQRLDRLTREEGQRTLAQTLEVVHSLMNNMTIVMKGMQRLLSLFISFD